MALIDGPEICPACQGARWVSSLGAPAHPGCTAEQVPPDKPCPMCNRGPVFDPANTACLICGTTQEVIASLATTPEDDILARLDAEFSDMPEPDDVEDLTLLSDLELTTRFNALRGEMLGKNMYDSNPATQEGRDQHSLRAALLIEMRRRGQQVDDG